MKKSIENTELLNILSDAVDMQRETLEVLKEAIIALKVAVEELKISRINSSGAAQYVPYVPPQYVPLGPYTNSGGWYK